MSSNNLVFTLGCRLNHWESNKINNLLEKNGKKNLLVLNTCSVTNEAVKNSIKKIKTLHKEYPTAKIIVTGCGVESNFDSFKSLPEVYKIINNKEKLSEEKWKSLKSNSQENSIIFSSSSFKENPSNSNVRKFVRIQSGCDHSCTFCIIPSCRGNSLSQKSFNINKEISLHLQKGTKEIILTGVDITSWGQDFKKKINLGDLVEDILVKNKSLKRLRLSSIDAAELDDKLMHLIKNEKKLMPHFHFSLQSLDDMILKRMKRRHNVKQIISLFESIRKASPYVTFGADMITGFPTESEKMFLNTYNLVRELKISHLHVFPYSVKSGTPASKMPQVPLKIRRERAKLLRKLGKENLLHTLKSFSNKKHHILIETTDGIGKTENNLTVKVNSSYNGAITEFIPTKINKNKLLIY